MNSSNKLLNVKLESPKAAMKKADGLVHNLCCLAIMDSKKDTLRL